MPSAITAKMHTTADAFFFNTLTPLHTMPAVQNTVVYALIKTSYFFDSLLKHKTSPVILAATDITKIMTLPKSPPSIGSQGSMMVKTASCIPIKIKAIPRTSGVRYTCISTPC